MHVAIVAAGPWRAREYFPNADRGVPEIRDRVFRTTTVAV